MNEKIRLCLEKLNEKNEILSELLNYVSKKDFKIDIDEVEHIHNYFAKRTKIFDELFKLEEQIKNLKLSNEEKSDPNIILSVSKNDKLINSIIELDKKNNIKLEQITNILKENIKSIKSAQKANVNYFGSYNSFSEGTQFDMSR